MGHFLWNCSEGRALFFEHLKNNLGKEFEHFKSCDVARISHFILETVLWVSHYEEWLCLVKSYIIISSIYGNCTNQSCMGLAMVCCSIEADQGRALYARARASLVSWEGEVI